MKNSYRGLAARTLAVAAIAATLSVTTVGTASAANDCDDKSKKYARTALPDLYAVQAWCNDINANRKARGGLDVTADLDVYTQWFTAKKKTYESDSRRALIGGTFHQIRSV
jgi:hypothetical protein